VLATLFSVIAPVLIIVAIGFGWRRLDKPFDTRMVTLMVTYVSTPCLVVATFQRVELAPGALETMALAALATHAAFLALGWLAVKAARQPVRVFLPSVVFANTGNVGLPLCLFAFGEEGLALGIAYFAVNVVFLFTIGMGLAAGRMTVRELVFSPLIWAVALSVVLMTTEITLPTWIGDTVSLLGGVTIPLMLLALGASLATLKVTSFGRSVYFAVVRLVLGVGVGWGVGLALGLEGVALGVVVIESAMPVAVFNYLFAARHDARPNEVAGVVVTSTVLGFAALPFVLAPLLP